MYASRYSLSYWDGIGRVLIGTPLPNINIYILGQNHYLQPVGVPGELVISGTGVARGYLNHPQLTAEKFIKKEIADDVPVVGSLYKTGDLARWMPDGNIEFLGRIDHQVKIRGFRVEPGEIENYLLKHENVKEVIVPALNDEAGDTFLAAYFVPATGIGDSGPESILRLKEYLSTVVPDYMVPTYVIPLDEL
ncbi:MAG: amino acid adenylation domain-containing protein, partial [bacterium]|nr:amino acid adenylation domain-containing protein [bacterium]